MLGERRRSAPARPPPSVLRPNTTSADRHVPVSAPFDGVHFWDDTDSDRLSGHTAESDNWTGTDNYARSTRAGTVLTKVVSCDSHPPLDLSQRLERLTSDHDQLTRCVYLYSIRRSRPCLRIK